MRDFSNYPEGNYKMYKLLTRSELYELVWEQPVTKVATALEISDVAVAKICRKHNIPVPGRGYWAKVTAEKRVRQTPLPNADTPYDQEIVIRGSAMKRYSERVNAVQDQSSEPNTKKSHYGKGQETPDPRTSPYIEKLKQRLSTAKPNREGFIKIRSKRQFAIHITPASTDRAIQVIDNIVTHALARGFQIKPTTNGLAFQVVEDFIQISLSEKLDRVPHEATDKETAKLARWEKNYQHKINAGEYVSTWNKPEIPEFDYLPQGKLMVEIDDGTHYDGIRRKFSDGKKQRIENMAERIVTTVAVCAAAAVDRREEKARRQREWELWEIQRKEQKRKQTLENKRWKFLKEKIESLEKALVLEQFVSDYQKHFVIDELPTSFQQLLRWTSVQAELIREAISPDKLEATLYKYKLMDDDTTIDSWVTFND